MKNTEITQMTFLPMGYMQNFGANPMAHSKSSQIPYMIKTNMQKKRSAAEAEPINPAAGSRDEPTRLHVEDPVAERKQGFEVQVTSALFL